VRFIVLINSEREQLKKNTKLALISLKEVVVCNYYFLAGKEVSRITEVDLQAVIRSFNAWDSASAENKRPPYQ